MDLETLFGFSEAEFLTLDTQEKVKYLSKMKMSYSKNIFKVGNKKFDIGEWSELTVNQILEKLFELDIKDEDKASEIEIVKGVDVAQAHLEAEEGEFFQTASQFNALEMIDPFKTPFDGIQIYLKDHTQGPRAALICLPSLFFRNYYLSLKLNGQFNALEKLKICPLNGYLVWGAEPQEMVDRDFFELKIPACLDTTIDGVYSKNKKFEYIKTDKKVSQIYASSAAVNTYLNGGSKRLQHQIIKKILYAEYVGTIALALYHHHKNNRKGSPVINLTLLGAGVFNNPLEIVAKAIKDAISYFKDFYFKVKIHCWKDGEYQFFKHYLIE